MTFEREHLKELVECSAAALKVEDDYIEERYQNRPKWRHKRNGLREWTDERYYQSVIWRALLGSKLPWRPETESGGNRHDIAFYDDERGCLVAVVEIKGGNGQRLSRDNVDITFVAETHPIAHIVTAEVYVTRLLNRTEFRTLCDQRKTPEAILRALK